MTDKKENYGKVHSKQYATALYEALETAKATERDLVVRRFAGVVTKNYDRALLPKIIMQLKKLQKVHGGQHEVVLTSARPLEKATIEEVKKKVGANSNITEVIDPNVLGGLRVLINDEIVIDGTLKGRIDRTVQQLLKVAE